MTLALIIAGFLVVNVVMASAFSLMALWADWGSVTVRRRGWRRRA